jgi:transcriptional regulator with XRE-family HTH domain
LIRQKRSLIGKELRFLRHQLGLSQPALANLLGESEQSVARREKRKKAWKKPTPQDRMLRYMLGQRLSGSERLEEFLQSLSSLDELKLRRVEFKKSKRTAQWERAEAPIAA